MKKLPGSLLLASLAFWMLPSASFAATNIVRIGDYWFNPTNITINVGDTVTWTNVGTVTHDSSSDLATNVWDSPNILAGNAYSFTFTNITGYYPYICALHINAHPEQTGTVTVVSAVLPPSVSITNPVNGALFAISPANISIQATATSSSGSVTNVQFFSGPTLLGTVTASPYNFTFSNVTVGAYTLTARTAASTGLTATSSVVNITVNALPSVSITNPPNNATFAAPAHVTIEAAASDSDGSVTNVQFLVGPIVLGNDTTSPYAAATNGLPAGNYTLSAVASDNRGARATNSISITVTNPPPSPVTILNPSRDGNSFSFSFATQTGYSYRAQYTASLSPLSWFTFTNLAGNGAVVRVKDSSLTNSQRFYRVAAQ